MCVLQPIGFDQHNLLVTGDVTMALLNARPDGHSVPVAFVAEGYDRYNQCVTGDKSPTLRTPKGGDSYGVVFTAGFLVNPSSKTRGIGYQEEVSATIIKGMVPAVVTRTNK